VPCLSAAGSYGKYSSDTGILDVLSADGTYRNSEVLVRTSGASGKKHSCFNNDEWRSPLLGSKEEARTLLDKLSARLAEEWEKPYQSSEVCGCINARTCMSNAIVRAAHLCLRGSRIPAAKSATASHILCSTNLTLSSATAPLHQLAHHTSHRLGSKSEPFSF
jgi:hypothetical protein